MVQIFARHKDMKCTMKYIHYQKVVYQSGNTDEWIVKVANTIEEATELLRVGFEYVTDWNSVKLFRKRK